MDPDCEWIGLDYEWMGMDHPDCEQVRPDYEKVNADCEHIGPDCEWLGPGCYKQLNSLFSFSKGGSQKLVFKITDSSAIQAI